jgi:hypothetical protein
MFVRRSLIPLAFVLFAARCSESNAPRPAGDQPLHFLRWVGGSSPQFSAIGAASDQPTVSGGAAGLAASVALSLDQNVATFWAVRGQPRSLQINYLSAGDTSHPFLRLTTSEPVYAPGIGDLAVGDSVLITVTVDAESLKVTLEPTGLVFGSPAQLQVWYGGAGGDLNGDGVADSTDAYIEQQLLGLWYREVLPDPWSPVTAVRSLADKSFTSELQHFCEYALSW